MSRLDSNIARLRAQRACLNAALALPAGVPAGRYFLYRADGRRPN